jgi:hypothetical protein
MKPSDIMKEYDDVMWWLFVLILSGMGGTGVVLWYKTWRLKMLS